MSHKVPTHVSSFLTKMWHPLVPIFAHFCLFHQIIILNFAINRSIIKLYRNIWRNNQTFRLTFVFCKVCTSCAHQEYTNAFTKFTPVGKFSKVRASCAHKWYTNAFIKFTPVRKLVFYFFDVFSDSGAGGLPETFLALL